MWSSLIKPSTNGVAVAAGRLLLTNQTTVAAVLASSVAAMHTSNTKGGAADAGGGVNYYVPMTRQRDWNRAVSTAEKLVGFPTSIFHLQSLMSDDVTSMGTHLRKLMTSDHPILKTIKRLIHHDGKTNAQVRGLIMLLLSRASATDAVKQMEDFDAKTGVLAKQRQLAEIIEMIQSAEAIHKSVLNLPLKLTEEDEGRENLRSDLDELEYGNKLAILGGDYLLASACTGLASLKNTYVSEMIAVSIAEFAQSEFLGKRDIQGRFVPDHPEHLTVNAWLNKTQLSIGSLMGKGCRSSGLIAGLPEEDCLLLQRIGSNMAMALQAFTEIEPYLEKNVMTFGSTGQVIDLSAAPVLFHLRTDQPLLAYIRDAQQNNIENLSSIKVYEAVKNGPGLAEAKNMCSNLSEECLQDLDKLPDTDAKAELIKLVSYLKY